ncbi:MAG: repeat protein, partial [Chthoniobacteraceae bacterium]|nr:repeat protein [Chthoniobacteraceae bacterium]
RKEIAPILQRRCAACHGEESAKGGYRLDSFARMGKPGDSDLAPLVAGKPADSELHQLLLEKAPDDRMPQKADPLPPGEIALIERWIREGAVNDGGAPDRSLAELVRDSLLLTAPEKYTRPAPVTALAFSPDGTQIAASGYYEVTLWDVETGGLVRRIGGLPERINSIAWNPKNHLIAVGGGSPSQWGGIFLIDPAAGFTVRLLADLPDTALGVAFAPDGKLLTACGGDRSIRLFDTATGKVIRLFKQHSELIQTIAFSRDGNRLVSASRDRTARVFSIHDGEVLAAYDDHEAPVMTAAFSPDGSTIFSVARGRPVHSWNAGNGKQIAQFINAGRDTQVLLDTAFGLITGSTDGVVRLSDPRDRRTLMTLFGHHDCVESIALAPNGQLFATGAHDGEVCIWELKCETWIRHFITSP